MKTNVANNVGKWIEKTSKRRIRKIREIVINWFAKTKWKNLTRTRVAKTLGNKIKIKSRDSSGFFCLYFKNGE